MAAWTSLTPTLGEAELLRRSVDPYLWMASGLGYPDSADADAGGIEPGPRQVEVAMEFSAASAPTHAGLTILCTAPGGRFMTGRATEEAIAAVAGTLAAPVVLAEAVVPQRPSRPWHSPATAGILSIDHPPAMDDGEPSATLIGIIDDGCPFAHADLRQAMGSTRVLRLWDQGSGANFRGLGRGPGHVAYGTELTRAHLNSLMKSSRRADGSVDEHGCYLMAGYGPVLARRSHGAHALGLMAGERLWRSRPGFGASGRRSAPGTLSAEADIVFVQLPHDVIRCVGVGALQARAFDAVCYIVGLAAERNCRRVVISFGYESWVGPHDGSDWFCRALDAVIEQAAKRDTEVVLHMPAGNSRDRKAHIFSQGTEALLAWDLNVPPHSEVPTFMEIWLPEQCCDLVVTLTPPGATPLPPVKCGAAVAWPSGDKPLAAVVMPLSTQGPRMVLLRIAPTRVRDGRQHPAPAGRWRVSVESQPGMLAGLHAYLGRSEETLGAARRAGQAGFGGRNAEQAAGDKTGTLNGHAMGAHTRVSAAYYWTGFPYRRNREKVLHGAQTDYSGTGPGRNGARARTNDAIAVEDGMFHPGVLGLGNRSACLFRMQGTSVSAPLRARRSVDTLGGASEATVDPAAAGQEQPDIDDFERLDPFEENAGDLQRDGVDQSSAPALNPAAS